MIVGAAAFALSSPVHADVVTKRGWVIAQRFEHGLKEVPPPEWKNPKTGNAYATWKEALDDADDLEDDDDEDDDGNVVETSRKPSNPKALLEGLKDADEDSERKRTPIRGMVIGGWVYPTTIGKVTTQDTLTDELEKTHKVLVKEDDDDDSPDDDDDVVIKRFLKPVEDDDKGASLFVPLLDHPFKLDRWWQHSSSRKALEEAAEARKARIEKAKRKLRCTRENKECVPKHDGTWAKFDRDLGDDDVVEIWTHALYGMKHRTADQIECSGSWDTGITIFKKKFSLVKLSGEIASNSDKHDIDGNASVYIKGQASWSKKGKLKDKFSRTFKTDKKEFEVPLLPFLSVTGGARASATFELKTALDAVENKRENVQRTRCSLKLTPGMTTQLVGEGSVNVGIPKVARVASGGIRVKISPLSAEIPVELGVATAKNDGIPVGSLFFHAGVDARFLSGRIEAFYRLGDVCTPRVRVCVPYFGCKTLVGKKCFIKDVLRIPTKGSKMLWKHKGFGFKKKIADRNAKIPWGTRDEQKPGKK